MLFHIMDEDAYARAIANLAVLVRPGGHVVLSENLLRDGRRHVGPAQISRSEDEILGLLRANGLEPVRRDPMFVLLNGPVDSDNPLLKAWWGGLTRVVSFRDQLGNVLGAVAVPGRAPRGPPRAARPLLEAPRLPSHRRVSEPPPQRHSLPRATFLALQADVVTAVSALVVAIIVARGLGTAGRGVYFLAILAATMIALVGNMGLATTAIVYGAKQRFPLGELHGMAITFSLDRRRARGGAAARLRGLLGLDRPRRRRPPDDDPRRDQHRAAGLRPDRRGDAHRDGPRARDLGDAHRAGHRRRRSSPSPRSSSATRSRSGPSRPGWRRPIGFAAALGWYAGRAIARPARPSRAAIREATSFSLRGHVGTLAHQGFLRIDVLFVSAKLGDSAVGLYAQASVLAERMSTLGHAVYSSSAARLGSDPPAAAAQLAAELVRVLLLVMVPVAIVLAILSQADHGRALRQRLRAGRGALRDPPARAPCA